MKPGIPWSVKGIEPDVREAAKEAARRSGMTLGEWLNSTILTKADGTADDLPLEPVRKAKTPSRAPAGSHALERTASRLEDIAEHLSRLSQRESFTAQSRYEATDRSADSESMNRILNRVDSNERQTVEAFTAVNERLSLLGRQIIQSTKQRNDRPEENPGYVALEKAVRNIVEHMETSEKRNRDNFKSLQERISGMSAKAAASPQEQVTRQAPAISQLEQRISELAKRVERSETSSPSPALPDLLKQELTDLANRIDVVRDTSVQLAAKAQTQAVQASQQELRAIEARILGLIKDAQSSLASNGPAPADMQRLRSEIERLNARIDEAQKSQASGGDVKALRAAVEQLSTRVAQGPDMRPLAEMDRRILDITQRLEQTQAQTRGLPQINQLEARIAELDHKLSEAVSGQQSTVSGEIEQHLFEITERVGRTEQQLSSLETIERAVNQLFESLERQKQWTQNVAETAASQMAQRIMSQPQQVSLAGTPEIHALQQGLQAVQQASESADHRNQETLEAVHETLEQIVSKLSELETATIGQRVAAAAMPQAALEAMDQNFHAAPALEHNYPETEITPTAAPEMMATAPSDVGNPLHAPELDPFTLQPAQHSSEQLTNPFESVIESARAGTTQAAAAAENDDFIAAARRAAQASFQPKSILSGISPGAAKLSEESSKKLLKFGMFKGKDKTPSAKAAPHPIGLSSEIKPPPGFVAANGNEKKRVRLVIMGLCLLAAASFFTFNMLGGSKTPTVPAVEPTRIEQQAPVQQGAAQPQAIPAPLENSVAPESNGATPAQPPQPKPAEMENRPAQQGSLETSDPILTASVDPAQVTDMSAARSKPARVEMSLRQAAAASSPEAFYATATRYLEGTHGVKQDYARAAYWYGKAAAQGVAPAQYRLGTLYERGKGVARDLEAAQGWYERAAGLGNVKAMHNAAVLAASSDGHKPDYARAFKWFSLGAAHGLKDSQYNLAVLLEHGLGTQVNLTEAVFWYTQAGKQNDPDAARRATTIGKTLTEADAKMIEDRVNRWLPDASPDASNATVLGQASWSTDAMPAG
jgi:localization factor PodJL